MIRPRALRPGDRIAIVAPASNCSREEFERGVFSAGSPETRAADFLRAWTDPSVAALVAVRGGYGSVQLLPHLPVAAMRSTPKLFVGYSDNTTILSWLTVQCGVPALH